MERVKMTTVMQLKFVEGAETFGLEANAIAAAVSATNAFLVDLPDTFKMSSKEFYSTLGQRNLSGFVGEVFKATLSREQKDFVLNPHPDGRPDLLDLRHESARLLYEKGFRGSDRQPMRSMFAPFECGGIEVKATIGNHRPGGALDIGESRVGHIRSINYWAHHQHACNLIGLYYDFSSPAAGSPQIAAVLGAKIEVFDWAPVSVGDPSRKKTSNTSLNAAGVRKVLGGLIGYYPDKKYVALLRKLRALS